jgi:hypothetical protein
LYTFHHTNFKEGKRQRVKIREIRFSDLSFLLLCCGAQALYSY